MKIKRSIHLRTMLNAIDKYMEDYGDAVVYDIKFRTAVQPGRACTFWICDDREQGYSGAAKINFTNRSEAYHIVRFDD